MSHLGHRALRKQGNESRATKAANLLKVNGMRYKYQISWSVTFFCYRYKWLCEVCELVRVYLHRLRRDIDCPDSLHPQGRCLWHSTTVEDATQPTKYASTNGSKSDLRFTISRTGQSWLPANIKALAVQQEDCISFKLCLSPRGI